MMNQLGLCQLYDWESKQSVGKQAHRSGNMPIILRQILKISIVFDSFAETGGNSHFQGVCWWMNRMKLIYLDWPVFRGMNKQKEKVLPVNHRADR